MTEADWRTVYFAIITAKLKVSSNVASLNNNWKICKSFLFVIIKTTLKRAAIEISDKFLVKAWQNKWAATVDYSFQPARTAPATL